jgi:pimeloyl-ACP methyl ester carboxylesterase
VEALADWTLALLDAAGVGATQTTTVVGHSMGSLIALEMAARAPERIRRLVMVGTAYPMKVADALLNAARDTPETGMDMVNAFSLSTMAAKPSYPGPGMWLHGGNRQLMGQVQARHTEANVFLHDFQLCNAYANGEQAAVAVRCPTHFVLGAADQMTTPRNTRLLAELLKPKVHLLPGGHGLMQEQPDAVLAALRDALA